MQLRVIRLLAIGLGIALALCLACGGGDDKTQERTETSDTFCKHLLACPEIAAQFGVDNDAECESFFDMLSPQSRNCVAGADSCIECGVCLSATNDDDDDDAIDDDFDDDVPEGYELGDRIPNFTLNDSDGYPVELYDYRGNVVLLDSSAMWCPPCQADTPTLETDFWQVYRDQGDGFAVIQMLGQNYQGSTPSTTELNSWKNKYGLTFPVVGDSNWQVGGRLGNSYIPHYTILDQEMVIQMKGNNLYTNHGKIRDLLGIH